MKFKITMKDPDTMHDAICDAVAKDVSAMDGLSNEEKAEIATIRREKVSELCSKWFEYSEYLTIEIDTELKTATVCEV